MKARTQRAEAQGIAEGDLPPVPRTVLEPPPLPPPEEHKRDLRKSGQGKSLRKAKGGPAKASREQPRTSAKGRSKSKSRKKPKG